MSLDFFLKHENKNEIKGAVLLFHGLTGSPFELKKYGQFLYNNGYDVYGECLPGHGEKFEEIYTVKYQDWLNFAYTRFKDLKAGYSKVFISVISLSTTLYLDGWRLPWYKFLIPIGLSTIIRCYYNYPECEPHGIKNLKTRSVVKKLLAKGDVGMNDFPMTGIYELVKLSAVVRKNLKKVISPILLIHSKEDDLTSVKSAEIVYSNISSEDKEKIILYDSYHMVLYDNEKEFVFNKAVSFLDNHVSLEQNIKETVCI